MDELGHEEVPTNFTLNVIQKIQAAQAPQATYTPILSQRGKLLILSTIFLIAILAIALPSSGEISGSLGPWFELLPMVSNTFGALLPSFPEGYSTTLPEWNLNPIYGYALLALSLFLVILARNTNRKLNW